MGNSLNCLQKPELSKREQFESNWIAWIAEPQGNQRYTSLKTGDVRKAYEDLQ